MCVALNDGNEHTYLLESDGLNPMTLAVPIGSIGSIVHHAPKVGSVVPLKPVG